MVCQVIYNYFRLRGRAKFIPGGNVFVFENKQRHTHSASVLFYFESAMVAKSKELPLLVGILNCTFI